MNITVLDGFTLNPGDLDWGSLAHLGNLSVYDRTEPGQIAERSADADILFTNKTIISSELINSLKKLKYIGVLATGYDVVDVGAARKKNIPVTNVPGYGPESVAQMVFAHLLNITNNVAGHARDVSSGGWAKNDDFCYLLSPQIELSGKTMGIVGYGQIGKAVGRLALAFGMQLLIHSRTEPESLPENTEFCGLNDLFSRSDVISLHCPLTDATRNMVNTDTLNSMKKSAILINCSRGPLVNEDDLARSLKQNSIAAAGLDVLSTEPPAKEHPLYNLKNCFITPHIAWATKEARERLLQIAVDNLRSFLAGKPQNVVNK